MFSSYISGNDFLLFFIIPYSSACSSYVDALSLAHFPSHPTWVVSSEISNWPHGFYNHLLQITHKSYSSPALSNYFRLCIHACACISQRLLKSNIVQSEFIIASPIPQRPPPAVFHMSVIDTITYLVTQARNQAGMFYFSSSSFSQGYNHPNISRICSLFSNLGPFFLLYFLRLIF